MTSYKDIMVRGALGGLLFALLEFAIGAITKGWNVLGLTALVFGIAWASGAGAALAVTLLGILRLDTKALAFLLTLTLLPVILVYNTSFYLPLAGYLLFKLLFRRAARSYGALLLTLLTILWLAPLFQGHSMVLVFTELQTVAIFFAALLLLDAIWHSILTALQSKPSTLLAITFVVTATGIAYLSTVFLVRLWGFNTMEYLQVGAIVLQLGLLIAGATITVATNPTKYSKLLFLIPPALASTLMFGFRLPESAAYIEERAPNSSLLLTILNTYTDSDKDGFTTIIGTPDCAPKSREINPLAIDIPNDGINQNCIAGDLHSTFHNFYSLPLETISPKKTANSKRKIAILLIVDTMRADYLNEQTPNMLNIAGTGSRFMNAYAQSNNTLESIPHMLHLGFRTLGRYDDKLTLRHLLNSVNIRNEAILQAGVQNWWNNNFHQVVMGFEDTFQPPKEIRRVTPAENINVALSRLNHNDPRDLFLFIHFEELHDAFTNIMEGERIVFGKGLNLSEFVSLMQPKRMADMMKQNYAAALTKIDAAIEPLWKRLKELERENDILFIVASDHGEEFFDHGGFFHMGTLYEELVKVPLVIYKTGLATNVQQQAVGLNQLTPTILRFFDFDGRGIRYIDLAQQHINRTDIFSLFELNNTPEKRSIMVLKDNQKLIYTSNKGHYQLFDLLQDPQEKNNLLREREYLHAAKTQKLMQLLDTTSYYLNYGDL